MRLPILQTRAHSVRRPAELRHRHSRHLPLERHLRLLKARRTLHTTVLPILLHTWTEGLRVRMMLRRKILWSLRWSRHMRTLHMWWELMSMWHLRGV